MKLCSPIGSLWKSRETGEVFELIKKHGPWLILRELEKKSLTYVPAEEYNNYTNTMLN